MTATRCDAVEQDQSQKAKNAIGLLKSSIEQAQSEELFGEVTITIKFQNGRIGHYERVVRETYK
jgi:hypothetical protein